MPPIDLKKSIASSIQSFSTGNLFENSISFFETLGYSSDRRMRIEPNTFEGFADFYPKLRDINKTKALTVNWLTVELLFQLTGEDITDTSQGRLSFEKRRVDDQIIESYLFLAIELTHQEYSRSKLADITREVNKVFAMPVMILFKNRDLLTLSIINRRLNKRDESKDVLEKVTLIKGINISTPNRAHIEILFDLSLQELEKNKQPNNFVELHKAWQDTLNISELNKKFYREIADWYFHAVENVNFPEGNIIDEKTRNATNVIRLITRLIFVWFIKEKGLVPDLLFDDEQLKGILNFTDPQGSTYYKAILQNLFFATLNTEMGSTRRFRGENPNPNGFDAHYGISSVYRYKEYFKDPDQALGLFADIPFLNGGLFECLDKREENLLVDGFSKIPENQPVVPDSLFFGTGLIVDMSKVYGDNQHTRENVRGLIHIFNSYKFTIEENTPIEEEIALDPELLGRVFENLLAAYNPETGETARRQTGSFYTPREIVNYMVDESLIAFLKISLQVDEYKDSEKSVLESKLRHLLDYNTEPTRFSEREQDQIISAINKVKVLDPACGSGAFPMGVLHKLVFILNKIDPGNAKWKQRQIEEALLISDPTARDRAVEAIENIFSGNELNYGRKLYLIQNSIFGVDIQPIAVQIAKLRFFISLVVDQYVDRTKPNLNILALPNLESKFVAANTLLGVEQPQQPGLPNQLIVVKEAELTKVRDSLFTARTHATKRKLREQDKKIRSEIAELLVKDGWGNKVSSMLSSWDPFDQNASAGFFDAKWMFGVDNGFDIILGNPPYIRSNNIDPKTKSLLQTPGLFTTLFGKFDVYVLFIEQALKILGSIGLLSFIIPYPYLSQSYASLSRKKLLDETKVLTIFDVSDIKVFSAKVAPIIFLARKEADNELRASNNIAVIKASDVFENQIETTVPQFAYSLTFDNMFRLQLNEKVRSLSRKFWKTSRPLSDYCYVGIGMDLHDSKTGASKERLIHTEKFGSSFKAYVEGKDIQRYGKPSWYRFVNYQPEIMHRPKYPELFENPKILAQVVVGREGIIATFDDEDLYAEQTLIVCVNKHLLAESGKKDSQATNEQVNVSKAHSIFYLLGLLNSKLINWYFRNWLSDELHVVPENLRQLPIHEINFSRPDEIALYTQIVTHVRELLSLRKEDKKNTLDKELHRNKTETIDSSIDKFVYDLYGLTKTEIDVIENS